MTSRDKPICDYTAGELAVLLAEGALSSVELTQACLDRIAALDSRINAVVTLNPRVITEAEASDARRRAGHLEMRLMHCGVNARGGVRGLTQSG
ncbi:MAG: hypothetical protein WCI21_07995 [Alphaproteobacteria bacterium]